MNDSNGATPERSVRRLLTSPWAMLFILAIAAGLRGWHLMDWSLWEDEETSIYYSQNPHKPFPRYFPVFFLALRGVYQLTGVSVAAGRMLSAAIGLGSIALLYVMARRRLTAAIALLAALLLAVNLGHLFWSQSIRYFMLLFVLELCSMHWFLEGFESGKYRYLLLSNLAFALAMWTHFSALLLLPVYVAYLFFTIVGRQRGGAYHVRGYLFFAVTHALLLALMAASFARFYRLLSTMAHPAAQDPIRLLFAATCYVGAPIIVLGLLAPVLAANASRRAALFFALAGALPILELVVIAGLNLSNVAWYYGIFALGGFNIAASITLVSLYQRGLRWSARLGGALAALYAVPLLLGYHTTMYGDRPRWAEAAGYLRSAANIKMDSGGNPPIFATVPGVVAFHLGVPPQQTMDCLLVRKVPNQLSTSSHEAEEWYVVESGQVSPDWQAWLENCCTLRASFDARTGPKDRTVFVYHYNVRADGDADASAKRRKAEVFWTGGER